MNVTGTAGELAGLILTCGISAVLFGFGALMVALAHEMWEGRS